jgi:soluble lytic murein transglycosylase-like protein
MDRRSTLPAGMILGTLALFCGSAQAQIAKITSGDGRQLFVNADPPATLKLTSLRPRSTIYMNAETPFTGFSRPSLSIDRDGAEKLVREAAERHHVDPAVIRAVIQTESNWNSGALSRKGAGGLMQLIPTTAQRFGASDLFNPQQNVDAGVRYLKTLLERYNGNLDLALAAYNAGEGAVDRAHGIPAFRETRDYVRKVQFAINSPGSGFSGSSFLRRPPIRRDVDATGRTIFSNE